MVVRRRRHGRRRRKDELEMMAEVWLQEEILREVLGSLTVGLEFPYHRDGVVMSISAVLPEEVLEDVAETPCVGVSTIRTIEVNTIVSLPSWMTIDVLL